MAYQISQFQIQLFQLEKFSIIFIFQMSIRRGWSLQQDKVLKLLKQQRKIKKWSSIAKIMDYQFNMCGRNGKQCRQRYNNHLDQGILQQKLSYEEQKILQSLNQQIGNKWSVIARAFKGRTANFLKNQLYSKLRKAVRKLNKFIKEIKLKQFKPFKLNIVYKIVQSNDFKIFEKQRHQLEDLKFYSQIKQKLFNYAQQPLMIEKQDSTQQIQTINQSRQIISKLNIFSKKYQALNKKLKKPRKRYFCQDDIILNSLSNNRIASNIIQNLKQKQKISSEQQQSDMSEQSQNESSSTSDKKPPQQMKNNQNKFQIKLYESKNFDNYKQKDYQYKQIDPMKNLSDKKQKHHKQIQKNANQNIKIVEEAQIDTHNKYSMLQESQQCQFIDIQYLDHFKSCSFIDESLFQ